MIDHLKDIVADSERYIEIFEIPLYLVNSNKVINQQSHFMEYFFCVLNAHLKSLSSIDPKHSFINEFMSICDYLEKANNNFLKVNGYSFKLTLTAKKKNNKRKKREIEIPLYESNLRKKLANFFYMLLNRASENTTFRLKLKIQKTKNVENEEEKLNFQNEDEINNLSNIEEVTKQIIKLKNTFKKKIMNKAKKGDFDTIDFEYLESVFIEHKKQNIIIDNFLVRFFGSYIYKQHMVRSRMGYLAAFIFILLILEMVIKKIIFLDFPSFGTIQLLC